MFSAQLLLRLLLDRVKATKSSLVLSPGVSEHELDLAERGLDIKLHPGLRAIWRFCDGQALTWDPHLAAENAFGAVAAPDAAQYSYTLGLLGGCG